MFLTMFFKTQNIGQTMHLTMLIAHPYPPLPQQIYVDSSIALIAAIEQVREFAGKFRGQPVRWFYVTR